MENFKSSQYDAGSVLSCEYKGAGEPDDYGSVPHKFEFQGQLFSWKVKDETRQEIFGHMTPGAKFRIIMKDTGKKFAYAEIKMDDGGDMSSTVKAAQSVFSAGSKPIAEKPTTYQSDEVQERIERAQMINLAHETLPEGSQTELIKLAEIYRKGQIGSYIRGEKLEDIDVPLDEDKPKADDLPF